ncbi:MAG: hypothetical protein H6730_25240 [Deltaproteobacteria bacterium]|nr:hypothetical protein [Deltaproteobacteria bacterium]
MSSEPWRIDPAYATQAAEAPTRASPGPKLAPSEVGGAMAAWIRLSAEKRVCCDLRAREAGPDDVRHSKFGGTPLFSRAELDRWPICEECGDEMQLRYQLFLRDVPCLPCPRDADGLQVFFCPNECGEEEASFSHRWIDAARITDPIDRPLGVPLAPARVLGRLVDDYPGVQELGPGGAWMATKVSGLTLDVDGEEVRFLYAWERWHHRGDKVGGYVDWVQDGWRCCSEPLYPIIQLEWAEGYQWVLGCAECGAIHTEYQGT